MRRSDAWVAAAAIAIYAGSWGHYFVSDDFLNLERGMFRTVADALALFSLHDTDFYRPLARLWFGVLAGSFGSSVLVWNVAGTLLHAGVSLLVLRLARSFLGPSRARAALGAALLFAIHYLHVEPVVWASGVAGLLATGGILAALLAFRRARRTGRARDAVLSVASFAAALASQETAVAFVPLLLATTWIWPPADAKGGSRRLPSIGEALPYAVLLAAYAWIATSIDRGGDATPYRFALGGHVVKNAAFFGIGSFVPARYWELQELWSGAGGLPAFLAALAARPLLLVPLLAGAAIWPWALLRGDRDIRGGLAWIAAASLPYLLLPGSGERFHLLPSAGACLVLACAAERWWDSTTSRVPRRGRALACAAVVCAFAASHLDRQHDWVVAGRWTRSIVSRWSYFRQSPPDETIEFVGVPDHYRSAWVFRNGFPSMVRLFWDGRRYARAEDRAGEAAPDRRFRVYPQPSGNLGMAEFPETPDAPASPRS